MYSPAMIDYFEHPRNSGVLPDPHASVQLENPVCGDVLKLTAKVANRTFVDLRFQAKGCVPTIACASALTELVIGRTLTQADQLRSGDIVHQVGGVPPTSTHAPQLAIDALQRLLDTFRKEAVRPGSSRG